MTMDEIINYAINSPENTNPNVLKSMLSQIISENNNQSNNNIEVIEFHISDTEPHTFDMTWQEIYDAFCRKAILYCKTDNQYIEDNYYVFVTYVGIQDNIYIVDIADHNTFTATSANDYPTPFVPGENNNGGTYL